MRTYVRTACLALLLSAAAVPIESNAADACSNTTKAAFSACKFEAQGDFWIGTGKCHNESKSNERVGCLANARESLEESTQECRNQRDARDELCGEATTGVVNLHGSATTPAASCRGDYLVTREFMPLSPGDEENKYYKPGLWHLVLRSCYKLIATTPRRGGSSATYQKKENQACAALPIGLHRSSRLSLRGW